MISLVEIQGPFLAIDGHVSAPTSGTVNQWSTGPIAVVHNSVAVAFGWNNRVGSDAGGESVVSIDSPFNWSLFNGGHLKTPPDPSLEAHFTIGYVPSHLLDATGSAAGMVILRIS
jgi:hypothetical protein